MHSYYLVHIYSNTVHRDTSYEQNLVPMKTSPPLGSDVYLLLLEGVSSVSNFVKFRVKGVMVSCFMRKKKREACAAML